MINDSAKIQTSFHLHAFWFHVTWNSDGTIGKDQHGDLWFDIQNPKSEARTRAINDFCNDQAKQLLQLR